MATWLRGQRYGHPYFKAIDRKAYFAKYQGYINSLLQNPQVRVEVACLADEPEIILAYAVYAPGCVIWAYTKKPWRGKGLQKKLLKGDFRAFSGLSAVGAAIGAKKGWIFDPWAGL